MKIEVPLPDYIKREYSVVSPRCFLIGGGPYDGYHAVVVPMLYTFGLTLMSEEGPFTRWCYEHRVIAIMALDLWDGLGDPPGEWIKQKPEDRHGPGSQVPLAERH
jgi:hypothetical protein